MRRNVTISAVLVAAFLAVVLGVALTAGGGDEEASAPPPSTQAEQQDAGPRPPVVAPDPRRLGRPGSSGVTFTEFLDFECEACGAAYPVVEQLRQEYAGRVTFNVRYFPIPSHQNAMPAALAVESASRQGKLEPMYQRMFQTQQQWGEKQESQASLFRSFAQNIGLDMGRFDTDVRSSRTQRRVQRDVDAGQALGVSGTPTFFINERLIEPRSFDDLRGQLDAALRGS